MDVHDHDSAAAIMVRGLRRSSVQVSAIPYRAFVIPFVCAVILIHTAIQMYIRPALFSDRLDFVCWKEFEWGCSFGAQRETEHAALPTTRETARLRVTVRTQALCSSSLTQ